MNRALLRVGLGPPHTYLLTVRQRLETNVASLCYPKAELQYVQDYSDKGVSPNDLHPRRSLCRPKHLESSARFRRIRLIGQDREGKQQVGKAQGALDQVLPQHKAIFHGRAQEGGPSVPRSRERRDYAPPTAGSR